MKFYIQISFFFRRSFSNTIKINSHNQTLQGLRPAAVATPVGIGTVVGPVNF
jgi:hypothetical protein